MQSTKYIRIVESKDVPPPTIMGIDAEAVRHCFGEQLAEIIAKHGLPTSEVGVSSDDTKDSQRVRAAGGGR